jgi:peptidoglycan/xylan/chitin deacetylase (PgdA/CDA1 family)
MRRFLTVIRNAACGSAALLLAASGAVRRARKRALAGGAITAIYFHRPNRRLFRRCVEWLARHGYTFISAAEVCGILHGEMPCPKGAVWLSFDDACKELLDAVMPVVREHGIPVTLFVPSGIVAGDGLLPWMHSAASGTNGASRNGARDSLTVAELKEIAARGEVTIGSHTVSHADTARCSEELLVREVGQSKRTLESWTGAAVPFFAYPYGHFSGREREHLVRHGYQLAATTENRFITPKVDPFLVPRFAVANNITFPEAVCNMVGVWRPLVDAVKRILGRA